ncbi:GGDEF domain-containing protein [Coxiella endosymbiont of Ornithodoros maritimus]|uniref:GGDEF domain-containing protein n=1 Tax=Coxiella endosymbiont of Ornithodoros maritimus TaxID=1656172 RepID=UPI002264E1C8|nr:GGDEF domain-containing protein [Coxiella endosymbiont of Ornithodoros maritimus]
MSVFLLDLNNFKAVNDNYGHRAGDQLLKKTTHRITSSARKRDLFFRIEGDEFLYLAFHDDASSIKEAEQSLLKKLESILRELEPKTGHFSIGYQTGPIKDIKMLISKADEAMYIDKQRSKSIY